MLSSSLYYYLDSFLQGLSKKLLDCRDASLSTCNNEPTSSSSSSSSSHRSKEQQQNNKLIEDPAANTIAAVKDLDVLPNKFGKTPLKIYL